MIPSRTNGPADEDVIVTRVPLVTGTPTHVRCRAGVDALSRIGLPIGVGAATIMLASGPVVGPPTTQRSVTSKGIVKTTDPVCATLVVLPKNAPKMESFGVCKVYAKSGCRS